MTFKEFQATRRLCLDFGKHPSEAVSSSDHSVNQSGFVYGPLPDNEWNLDNWLFIEVGSDGTFDTCCEGYPHMDCHLSFDAAERQLYDFGVREGMIPA